MKLALFIFTMSLTVTAFASPLDRINRESTVCLGKTYSEEHLRARPTQTVKSIAVQLFEQPDQKDNTVYLNMQIERAAAAGAETSTYDAFMLCDRNRDGLSCAVECDGGSADVITIGKSENQLQFVNRGFMMSGGCGGAQGDADVWLEPTAGGDDVFELDSANGCGN